MLRNLLKIDQKMTSSGREKEGKTNEIKERGKKSSVEILNRKESERG
jgi:hypothetical protein